MLTHDRSTCFVARLPDGACRRRSYHLAALRNKYPIPTPSRPAKIPNDAPSPHHFNHRRTLDGRPNQTFPIPLIVPRPCQSQAGMMPAHHERLRQETRRPRPSRGAINSEPTNSPARRGRAPWRHQKKRRTRFDERAISMISISVRARVEAGRVEMDRSGSADRCRG